MSFLFGRARSRTAADLPKQARDLLRNGTGRTEDLAKLLSQMKLVLQGEPDSNPDQIYQLVTSVIEEDLLYHLALNLHRLPFESRKDTQVIFSYIFRFRPAGASQKSDPVALSYVVNQRPQVLIELCRGYDHKESATPAGTVLREVLKVEAAAAVILYDDGEKEGSSAYGLAGIARDKPQGGNGVFWRFFDWIDKSSFEVAADAFTTFRVSTVESLSLRLPRMRGPKTPNTWPASYLGALDKADHRNEIIRKKLKKVEEIDGMNADDILGLEENNSDI